MRKIFLDTNFVLDTVLWKIDLFGELRRVCDFAYEIILLSNVRDEIKKIQGLGGKRKEVATVALLILDKNNVKSMKAKGHVDDSLVQLTELGDIVATQDKDLKRRLKEKQIGSIIIREKGYLELIDRVLT
ncbi:MAG: PIN domain-containing protein [Nanoarchaeota archaeon]